MARANQGGSILGFVVAAVVMAGLLIGGVYALRQLTAQPEEVASQPQKTAKPKQEQPKAQKQTKKSSDSKDSNPGSQSNDTSSSSPKETTQLPQTGPESLLSSVVILATLSGVAVSYARSRRPELSL